ncbi:MAG: LamG domain-containing protein [Planctomycetes bacterium]|nr:LamG domain-containing protein [Planctomycetota bacterium]
MPEGRLAGALAFDGKGDYVTIKGCKGVLGTQARTVAAWIKTTTSDYADLVSWGVPEPQAQWLMLLTRGSRAEAYGALQVAVGTGFVTGKTRLTKGQWHHVAAVLEPDENPSVRHIRLYVDGRPEAITASADSPIHTVAGPDVTLGVRAAGERHFFSGTMDDVRIYRRALTAAEVQELASVGP